MSYRVLKTISFSLSSQSINGAIREIELCKKMLVLSLNDLINRLTEQGVEIAKVQVASMEAVDTGELLGSIYGYYDEQSRIGYIIAGAPHAFYVEYGTGVVGAASPHPEADEAGWAYAIGDTIHVTTDGRIGWVYDPSSDGVTGGDGSHWYFTEGMPARPFMYNTMQWLTEAAEALGKDINL